jgi:hypothetical protein
MFLRPHHVPIESLRSLMGCLGLKYTQLSTQSLTQFHEAQLCRLFKQSIQTLVSKPKSRFVRYWVGWAGSRSQR